MEKLNNRKELKDKRQQLRNNATPAERQLWKYLKECQIDNRKFRRQHSFGNYILDFYCPSEMLAIELDGHMHTFITSAEYDGKRTAYLNSYGIKVIRFENKEVFEDIEGVLRIVRASFKNHPPLTPP